MRTGIALLLISLLAIPAMALADVDRSDVFDMDAIEAAKEAESGGGSSGGGTMVGGDTIADAVPITALPFSDTGNTCDYNNDYDAACPYTGGTAPDVVYSYSPATNVILTIDLCASLYDTKVYVMDDGLTVLACNDDACGESGWRSRIDAVALAGGGTYYIVVDGYGTECGIYYLDVFEWEPCCQLTCPEGALHESEPVCYDGFDDVYNGGCNSVPEVFEPVDPSCETITICGTSGTYIYDGYEYRDTDWYEMVVEEEMWITVCCTAEFPLQLITLDGTNGCASVVQIDYAIVQCCDVACLSHMYLPGVYWIWVGPSVYTGLPCGLEYILTIDGYHGAGMSPATTSEWGQIKSLFK